MSDISISITVYSRGISSKPSPSDKATKLEANYRPAYLDSHNQEEERVATRSSSARARGRMDHMEIPKGAPSEEGPGEAVGTLWRRECGTCKHFSANSCDIVVGVIDHEYVCDWWEADAG